MANDQNYCHLVKEVGNILPTCENYCPLGYDGRPISSDCEDAAIIQLRINNARKKEELVDIITQFL